MRHYEPGKKSVSPPIQERGDRHAWSFDLQAITPIYKGAANPDSVDPSYPFRGPSLRGQLRTWWRAMQPTTAVRELWDREHRLFGGVFKDDEPRASRVHVGLSDMSSSPCKKGDLRARAGSELPYALWVDRRGEHLAYHVDARATMHLSAARLGTACEPDDDELRGLVDVARAMVLFGGAGSRSRRGLGRLWSDDLLGATVSGPAALASLIAPLCPPRATRPWPSLAGALIAWKEGAPRTASLAANEALEDFKALRGMKSVDGRRFVAGERLDQAQADWIAVRDGTDMPQAFTPALGMPLLYRSSNRHLQGTTDVLPEGRDRLPSPVHVRPVPVGGGQYAAVLLLLQPWYRGEIRADNRLMRRKNRGSLAHDAIWILAEGFARKGWEIHAIGGAP